ncbi:MAG: PAS domain-containing protein [Patescibacteria group bacterium]|jgi:hypothetical protein|nr:PAS domain-containing protein [Patescibacteria group bacterium]
MKNFKMEEFNEKVLLGEATWWQMEIPSGSVIFGEQKAKMLGYPDTNFKNFSDFTSLVKDEDREKAMEAMRACLAEKNELYEAVYNIKKSNGEYIKFYDLGQVIKREGKNITVIGFVMKVHNNEDIFSQMKEFKEMILSGKPSIVELIANIKKTS